MGRAPVRKVKASGLGGAVATVVLWLVSLTGVDVPAPVAGAITLIVMSAAGYQAAPEQRKEHGMAYEQARVDIALDSANADITHAQLHDGAPGAAGTDNVLAEASRVAITLPASSSGESEDEISFTISGAAGPITHVSLWDADTSGTLQGSGVLSPQETFAGAGTLDVTVTTTASST